MACWRRHSFKVFASYMAGAFRSLLPLATMMALVLSVGCKKPEQDLGLELLPVDALGVQVDTAALHAYVIADSNIRTSGLTRNLVGSYLDPHFGSVRAGIVTQVRLSSNIPLGQDNSGLVADSLVLALAFDGINYAYGDLSGQVFQVYELSESLSLDSVYRSDRIPDFHPEDQVAVRGGRLVPQPLRNVVIGGDSLQPQLRIKLGRDLAQRLLNAFGTSNLVDNAAFLEFFKGLYIKVDNGQQLPFQQGLLYFNLTNAASKMVLYYRDTTTDPVESRVFDFVINQSCVRYTVVEHEHQAALYPYLPTLLADTSLAATATYVQALGGLRTVVRFPDIMRYDSAGLVLAKAELIMPLSGTYDPFLPPPAQLFLFRKDDAGADAFLPDQLAGLGVIDGNFRPTEQAYRFNITRYVQGVLNGSLPNNGLELVPASNGITANRVMLTGPASAEKPMRLRLTFTTY